MADEKNGPEYRYYRGEGGVVWEYELPLTPEISDQIRLGRLIEVPKPEIREGTDKPDDADTSSQRVAVREPAPNEPKSVWVDFAISHGMSRADAQNHSRQELIEKFTNKPDQGGTGTSTRTPSK